MLVLIFYIFNNIQVVLTAFEPDYLSTPIPNVPTSTVQDKFEDLEDHTLSDEYNEIVNPSNVQDDSEDQEDIGLCVEYDEIECEHPTTVLENTEGPSTSKPSRRTSSIFR